MKKFNIFFLIDKLQILIIFNLIIILNQHHFTNRNIKFLKFEN